MGKFELRTVTDVKGVKPYQELVDSKGIVVWSENMADACLDRIMCDYVNSSKEEYILKLATYTAHALASQAVDINAETLELTFEADVKDSRKTIKLTMVQKDAE